VTGQISHERRLLNVPEMYIARGQSDGKLVAALSPGDATDGVVAANIAKLRHAASEAIPDVDGTVKANGEEVGRGPVKEVEVKVITERRRVKHFEGGASDAARRAAAAAVGSGARVGANGRERVGGSGSGGARGVVGKTPAEEGALRAGGAGGRGGSRARGRAGGLGE
jgi:hypothetical protein